MITSISLRNWRNIVDADIDLQSQHYLVGANASGKSNFLDAIVFLRDVASVGFQEAVKKRGGVKKIRNMWVKGRGNNDVVIAIDCQIEKEKWSYYLQFGNPQNGDNSIPRIKEEVLQITEGKTIISRTEKQLSENQEEAQTT